jgi:two-component system, sensor histidine kinase and response regulator
MRDHQNAFGASLLLVEDEPINADIASRILQKMGLRVTLAENGVAALQSWRQEKFDLVLMDCEMAEMDGFEATRQIRKLEARKSHTPIVALTAHSAADVRDQCLTAGMDDVLGKPFKDRQVAALLERWIGAPDPLATGPATAAQGVIDQTAFDQISAFQGPDGIRLLGAVAARFAETAPRQVRALREKHEEGDAEEVRRIAHTLKSSSAAMGATYVSQACADIERHAGDAARRSAYLSALEKALPPALAHLMEIARGRDEQANAHG